MFVESPEDPATGGDERGWEICRLPDQSVWQQVQGGVEDPVLGVTEPDQLPSVTQAAGRPGQGEL